MASHISSADSNGCIVATSLLACKTQRAGSLLTQALSLMHDSMRKANISGQALFDTGPLIGA